MVAKSKQIRRKEASKGRVKLAKLKLNKETVRELTAGEQKRVKGGVGRKDGDPYSRDAGCE